MRTKNRKKPIGKGLLILAVICFINPNINIIDLIPDFIGAFIIAKYISYLSDRVPYFAEAKIAFMKLGLVSLFKIPAFFIMTSVRSSNVSDNDIVALFVFSFAICEIVFFYIAIDNLFSGLFYLGERSDVAALISPFNVGRKKKRFSLSPERLKVWIIASGVIKLASAVVPELFLLTKGIDSTNGPAAFNIYSAYPYATVICFIIALAVGIAVTKRTVAYIRTISSQMDLYSEADKLITPEIAHELEKRLTVKDLSFVMTLIAAASFFTVEIREGTLKEINLVPSFAFALLMLFALYKLREYIKVGIPVYIAGGALFGLISARQMIEGHFLDTLGYTDLVYYDEAKAAYIPTIVISAVEALAAGVFLALLALTLIRLTKQHTGISENSPKYSQIDKDREVALKRLIITWCASGFALWIIKLLNVTFKYFSTVKVIAVEDGFANITMSKYPWFGTVFFAASVAFVLFTLFVTSRIKDEIVFAYGEDGTL